MDLPVFGQRGQHPELPGRQRGRPEQREPLRQWGFRRIDAEVVDDGARAAIQRQGKSLLAIGIVDVQGSFRKGDVVSIRDSTGVEFARGLSNYSAAEAAQIKRMKTEQIAAALGKCPHDEVVHRDNMAVTIAEAAP